MFVDRMGCKLNAFEKLATKANSKTVSNFIFYELALRTTPLTTPID